MINVPEELSKRAIAEMEISFGFSEGVAENFLTTMEIAIESHQYFLNSPSNPNRASSIHVSSFPNIRPERRAAMAKTIATAKENISEAVSANLQLLQDSHRLRLGTFFRINGHISDETADALADWLVANIS